MARLTIELLPDTGDERGRSFQIIRHLDNFLSDIRDLHLVSIRPGFNRGNHYHRDRQEVLLIQWKSNWRLVWRELGQQATIERSFEGEGAAAVFVPRHVSHAVVNDGSQDLWITAILDGTYDPNAPDVVRADVL